MFLIRKYRKFKAINKTISISMRSNGILIGICFAIIYVFIVSPASAQGDDLPPPLKITSSSISGEQGNQVCVSFAVEDFDNIVSLQFSIHFDPTVVSPICPPSILNLLGLSSNNFNCNSSDEGHLNMLWTDPNVGISGGVTLPDGEEIFSICFDLIGDPGEDSPVYGSDDQLDVEYCQIVEEGTDDCVSREELIFEQGEIIIECGSLGINTFQCESIATGNTGSIRFYACGGIVPYTYDINGGAFTGTLNEDREETIIENLSAGNYSIVITDNNGTMITENVTISTNAPLMATYDITNPTCYYRENGRIELTDITGGVPPYNYNWDNFQFDNPSYRRLNNGTYGLTITDSYGCRLEEVIDIFTDTLTVSSVIQTEPTCVGADNGEVLFTAEGGTPFSGVDYIFNNFGPQVQYLNRMATDGWNYVNVQDANGCAAEDSVFLNAQTSVTTTVITENVSCFGANDGEFLLTAMGSTNFGLVDMVDEFGDRPPIVRSTTNQFDSDSLWPGIWYIEIEDLILGCTSIDTIEIFEPEPLTIVADSINPSCLDGDGEITVTGMGGTIGMGNDYQYNWDDGSMGATRNNLTGGSYMVVVSDDNGCTEEATINLIPGGVLMVEASLVQGVDCENPDAGIVTVEVLNQGNFQYTWYKGGTEVGNQQTLNGITSGQYIVEVEDIDLGCMASDTVNVPNPSDIAIDVTYTLPQCPFPEFNNGSIGVTVTMGTPDFSYSWEDGSTGTVLGGIAAGDYGLTITDANNCMLDTILTLDNPPAIEVIVSNIEGVTCNGVNNGRALAMASGGTIDNGSYNFIWSSAPDDVDFNVNTSQADALYAGTQYVIATDAQCPSDTIFFDVPDIEKIIIDPENSIINDPLCYDDCNGSIAAQATGGSGSGFSFQWTFDGSVGNSLAGLCADTYYVIITDANDCSVTDSIILNNPDSLALSIDPGTTVDINCFNDGNAQIGVIAGGGTPDYNYTWTDNLSDNTIASGLDDGTYFITVTDNNGCSDVTSYTLTSPEPISATIPEPEEPQCFGDKTCLTVSEAMGGTGNNYTFTINRGIRFPLDSCISVFAGTYTVTVFDSVGCSEEYMIDIDQPEEVIVDLGPDIEISLGEASPPISADISAVFSIDSIQWGPIDSLRCLTADCQVVEVSPNNTTTYTTRIVDENGCSDTDEITVNVNKKRNVYAANIFSPNGDGVNETFDIVTGPGVSMIESFQIYDRWGNLVFSKNNYNPGENTEDGWKGTFGENNQALPGVYVFVAKVTYIDNPEVAFEFKGSVTLIR